ncbi:uncharacterized protein LTR77_004767 [Saxophila tyrrhenica]|uniref:F-box domain-containing protein n=1 Tax=Saxophila tyrrhenica TaxID=1690608 RepID=A0AAV9PDI0_9PEZI|nr:hypothetical protein LTR77_004767 [Saxophila tyrrhenica]
MPTAMSGGSIPEAFAMKRQTAYSPFQKLPAEMLELILDYMGLAAHVELSVYNFHQFLWWTRDRVPDLKPLRLAIREYTYLPRLLSRFFHTIWLDDSAKRLETLCTTNVSHMSPYFRRVVFDTDRDGIVAADGLNPNPLRVAFTNILRKMPKVDTFYIRTSQKATFHAIIWSLSAASNRISHLYLETHTESSSEWASHGTFDWLALLSLQTLVFCPQRLEDLRDVEEFFDRDFAERRGSSINDFLNRCSQSLRFLGIRNVDFREVYIGDGMPPLTIRHHTGEQGRYKHHKDAHMNLQYSLAMYLSGLGEWNRSLRLWFDSDLTESDEEYMLTGGDSESDGNGEDDATEDVDGPSQDGDRDLE